MSTFALFGAIEMGLIYGLVALGVYLSFRVLQFPDLTVDGSFPLGAAVAAILIVHQVDPWLATLAALLAGAAAGLVTAWLNLRLRILNLLASILVMIALYSINLRIMGRPNVALLGERTILTPLQDLALPTYMLTPLAFAVGLIVIKWLLDRFLNSELGLALRATGVNPRMAQAHGIRVQFAIFLGMALSNALVALAGALFAQAQGSADVMMGVGTIVVGLAAVIGGEALLNPRTVAWATTACILGSLLYRLAVALALNAGLFGLQAQDLNLVTAVLVALALVLPRLRVKGRA